MELIEFGREDSGIESDSGVPTDRRRPNLLELSESSEAEENDKINFRLERAIWNKYPVVCDNYFRSSYRGTWREPILSAPKRAASPLYEVELTASDEEDEGSVLELVIPMRSSRYPRKDLEAFDWKLCCMYLCCATCVYK